MSLRWRKFPLFLAAPLASLLVSSCGKDIVDPQKPEIKLASIIIDGGPRQIEIGPPITLTATAKDTSGKVVVVPYVWRSTIDSIASFGLDGVLTLHDTGSVFVTASALGVTSGSVQILITLSGATKIDLFHFTPPNAIVPGVVPGDSIRAIVTNRLGGAAVGSTVVFAVTAGGGTISPRVATVTSTGVVASQWTLGPNVGLNTVTATVVGVVGVDSTLDTRVTGNPATFSITSYTPLVAVQGDGQTGAILSALPLNPSVRLTDVAGKPRPGIPITFTPSGNGRVARPVVSTDVDGNASPGVWTLGDVLGDQQLVATIESAKLAFHATATGGTVHYAAIQLATTQNATCALTNDQFVACLGAWPQIGNTDTASQSVPTLTGGSVHFTSVVGAAGGAHFCGIRSPDLSIFCWGISALVDTSGVNVNNSVPTRLPGNIAWLQVAPGGQHNCALAQDNTAYCWGQDQSGQLGDHGSTPRFVPQPVTGGFKFYTIASGNAYSCGLSATDSTAFCWGSNSNGQLGDGTTTNRDSPTAVKNGLKFQAIGAGGALTCGLSGGTAYCWGTGAGLVPTLYTDAPKFSSLSVGSGHACALTSDGTAYCWGDNSTGQLGDSTTTTRTKPTLVVTDLKFKSVSAGVTHTCAITTDGFVACWGRNVNGEIGLTVPAIQTTPRYIVLSVTPPATSKR